MGILCARHSVSSYVVRQKGALLADAHQIVFVCVFVQSGRGRGRVGGDGAGGALWYSSVINIFHAKQPSNQAVSQPAS